MSSMVVRRVELDGVKFLTVERWTSYFWKGAPESDPVYRVQLRSAPFECSVLGWFRVTPSVL